MKKIIFQKSKSGLVDKYKNTGNKKVTYRKHLDNKQVTETILKVTNGEQIDNASGNAKDLAKIFYYIVQLCVSYLISNFKILLINQIESKPVLMLARIKDSQLDFKHSDTGNDLGNDNSYSSSSYKRITTTVFRERLLFFKRPVDYQSAQINVDTIFWSAYIQLQIYFKNKYFTRPKKIILSVCVWSNNPCWL